MSTRLCVCVRYVSQLHGCYSDSAVQLSPTCQLRSARFKVSRVVASEAMSEEMLDGELRLRRVFLAYARRARSLSALEVAAYHLLESCELEREKEAAVSTSHRQAKDAPHAAEATATSLGVAGAASPSPAAIALPSSRMSAAPTGAREGTSDLIEREESARLVSGAFVSYAPPFPRRADVTQCTFPTST